nr:MAG TPA: hypothetical protein [Caudoviricetes sp.]
MDFINPNAIPINLVIIPFTHPAVAFMGERNNVFFYNTISFILIIN